MLASCSRRPTASNWRAGRWLISPSAARRPFRPGLQTAYEVITRELRQHPDLMPLMVLLTDGAGNVSTTNLPPLEEARRAAEMFPLAHIRSVVINMEHEAFDQGLAQALADHLEAPCYTLGRTEGRGAVADGARGIGGAVVLSRRKRKSKAFFKPAGGYWNQKPCASEF